MAYKGRCASSLTSVFMEGSKVRHNLGALVKEVRLRKEYVVLEKNGIPVAALMDIDEFEDYLELQDPKVQEAIRKVQEEYLAGKTSPAEELLEKLRRDAAKAKRTVLRGRSTRRA